MKTKVPWIAVALLSAYIIQTARSQDRQLPPQPAAPGRYQLVQGGDWPYKIDTYTGITWYRLQFRDATTRPRE